VINAAVEPRGEFKGVRVTVSGNAREEYSESGQVEVACLARKTVGYYGIRLRREFGPTLTSVTRRQDIPEEDVFYLEWRDSVSEEAGASGDCGSLSEESEASVALSDDSLPSLEDPEVGNASDSQERAESSAVEHFSMLVTQLRFGAVSAGVPIFQTLPSDDESGISSHGMSGSGVGSPSPKKGPGRARRLPPQLL